MLDQLLDWLLSGAFRSVKNKVISSVKKGTRKKMGIMEPILLLAGIGLLVELFKKQIKK